MLLLTLSYELGCQNILSGAKIYSTKVLQTADAKITIKIVNAVGTKISNTKIFYPMEVKKKHHQNIPCCGCQNIQYQNILSQWVPK